MKPLVSLLWPRGAPGQASPEIRLGAGASADLELNEIVQALTGGEGTRSSFVMSVLMELGTNPRVIVYRQQVIADLLEDHRLRERLGEVLPLLVRRRQHRDPLSREPWSVTTVARRVAELERYVEVAVRLHRALTEASPRGAALLGLRAHLDELTNAAQFKSLQKQLPKLRATLNKVRSVTVGINVSESLEPGSATILSISPEVIKGPASMLGKLLGRDAGMRGITPLHVTDWSPRDPLFNDMRNLIEKVVDPVARAIRRFTSVDAGSFSGLEPELSFYLNGVELIRRLRKAALPVCRPEVAPPDERVLRLEDGYSISLALQVLTKGTDPEAVAATSVVTNKIRFDQEQGRIWVLTGPNRGGKTTYTRAVGQAQILFQAGLHVPASQARLSPADAIYTHFPRLEEEQLGQGRLDEEAKRLARVFKSATRYSLILLNEVLAGTSAIEALGIAFDAMRGLRLLGARAIYTTHLHELAARADEINAGTPGDALVGSLVAQVDEEADAAQSHHARTFRIIAGPPRGSSYASEIAEQHGISYPQLEELLHEREQVAKPSAKS